MFWPKSEEKKPLPDPAVENLIDRANVTSDLAGGEFIDTMPVANSRTKVGKAPVSDVLSKRFGKVIDGTAVRVIDQKGSFA